MTRSTTSTARISWESACASSWPAPPGAVETVVAETAVAAIETAAPVAIGTVTAAVAAAVGVTTVGDVTAGAEDRQVPEPDTGSSSTTSPRVPPGRSGFRN